MENWEWGHVVMGLIEMGEVRMENWKMSISANGKVSKVAGKWDNVNGEYVAEKAMVNGAALA